MSTATSWFSDVAPTAVKTPATEELKGLNQWVCWQWVERKGKRTKPPMKATGGNADSTNPDTWATYQEARRGERRFNYDGVGCVLANGYAGVDLDNCRDKETGEILPEAQALIAELDSYTEISPSLTGVKVFLKTDEPLPQGRNKDMGEWSIELYSHDRYFTVTGYHLPGTPETINNRTAVLHELYERLTEGEAQEGAPDVTFSNNGHGGKPDLSKFNLSTAHTALVKYGYPNGTEDRSSLDQSVITAVVYGGASDDEIKAIFDHYPIGTQGKYAEKGRNAIKYLATCIGNARQYAASNGRGPGAPDGGGKQRKKVKTADYVAALGQLGYTFRMNDLDDSIEVNDERISGGLQAHIDNQMRDMGFNSTPRIENAYTAAAHLNRYHPIRDYLESLEADGGDYIGWLMQFLVTGDPFAKRFIRRWLIGAVAKAYKPTQNFCLTLDGKQGIGKSHLARWLCPLPEYFSESPFQAGNTDSRIQKMRTWIWELGELQAITRKSDREALKHEISELMVEERLPYAKHAIKKPNLTSFIGTINENGAGFLNDPTGYRRFVVVKLEDITWDYATTIDVNKIWAQAVALYRQGEPWQLSADEQYRQRAINEGYESASVLEEMFFKYFEIDEEATGREESDWMPAIDIIQELEEEGLKGYQRANLMELAGLMTKLEVEKDRPRLEVETGGKTKKRRVTAYLGVTRR